MSRSVATIIPAEIPEELFPDSSVALTFDQIGFAWLFWDAFGSKFEGFIADSEYLMVGLYHFSERAYLCGLTRDYQFVDKEIDKYDARLYPILQ